MKSLLDGKNIQIFVAHHDDESLYFGGLLTILKGMDKTKVKITVMTFPFEGRPDTNTRIESFKNVCWILGCDYSLYGLQDMPPVPSTTPSRVNEQLIPACDIVKFEILSFVPQIILTHNPCGEANGIYMNGHPIHKLVYDAVFQSSIGLNISLLVDGIGMSEFDYLVEYNAGHKKTLLDCYAPHWTPTNYPFAYSPEKYKVVR